MTAPQGRAHVWPRSHCHHYAHANPAVFRLCEATRDARPLARAWTAEGDPRRGLLPLLVEATEVESREDARGMETLAGKLERLTKQVRAMVRAAEEVTP